MSRDLLLPQRNEAGGPQRHLAIAADGRRRVGVVDPRTAEAEETRQGESVTALLRLHNTPRAGEPQLKKQTEQKAGGNCFPGLVHNKAQGLQFFQSQRQGKTILFRIISESSV